MCVYENMHVHVTIGIPPPQPPMMLLCLPGSATPVKVIFSIKAWEESILHFFDFQGWC